jgi:hypothetical protein
MLVIPELGRKPEAGRTDSDDYLSARTFFVNEVNIVMQCMLCLAGVSTCFSIKMICSVPKNQSLQNF